MLTQTDTADIALLKLLESKRRHALLSHQEVQSLCSTQPTFWIEGLLPKKSIGIMVGDSGLGKSPFVYQMGICVVSGIPFLGFPTVQGRVVILDYENGFANTERIVDRLQSYLRVKVQENELLFFSLTSVRPPDIPAMCADLRPALVIVDSLRSHDPQIGKVKLVE